LGVISFSFSFKKNNKLSNLFVVILEQLRFSVIAKHKWSAIALLNSILSSTESIEKRLSYRNILHCKFIFVLILLLNNSFSFSKWFITNIRTSSN
jgi:hypothetical protein